MKTKQILLLIIGVALSSLWLSPDASLLADKKKKFGAIVIGKSVLGPPIARACMNQSSESKALKCARKKLRKAGGLQELKHRTWDCKGWISAAYGSNGAIGIAWCRNSREEAQVEAIQTCAKFKGVGCAPFYNKKDK